MSRLLDWLGVASPALFAVTITVALALNLIVTRWQRRLAKKNLVEQLETLQATRRIAELERAILILKEYLSNRDALSSSDPEEDLIGLSKREAIK